MGTRASASGTDTEQAPLVLGGPHLEPAAWLGLAILGFVVTLMSGVLWEFAGQGPWPVPIVWVVALPIAVRLLSTRALRLADAGVMVTRHLLGRRWTRAIPRNRFDLVRVDCAHVPPRHSHGDGTPEGEAPLLMFTVTLRGRSRLTLGFARDVVPMEALARRAAALLGLPMQRRGYVRRATDGLPLRQQGVVPLAP